MFWPRCEPQHWARSPTGERSRPPPAPPKSLRVGLRDARGFRPQLSPEIWSSSAAAQQVAARGTAQAAFMHTNHRLAIFPLRATSLNRFHLARGRPRAVRPPGGRTIATATCCSSIDRRSPHTADRRRGRRSRLAAGQLTGWSRRPAGFAAFESVNTTTNSQTDSQTARQPKASQIVHCEANQVAVGRRSLARSRLT